ncbi:MAG: hypothetical protein HN719_08840 [Alphaproteobacteria bacterium]|jgi:hypothetical protein|nr:hypothetical protein [Alphaproteobacteria bacterium]
MGKKLLSSDPLLRKKTWLTDDADGLGIQTEQDATAVLATAKAEEAAWRPGQMIGNTQRHHQKVAEIPTALYFDLLAKFGDPKHNKKKWLAWLQDNDNKHFRTTGGRLA